MINWLTSEMMFGPGNTFTYVSPRQNYAGVEQGYGSFMGAIEKSLGAAGSAKLMQDFGNCLSSTRGEFRRRRWDLSANAPTSESAMNQLVGQGRWLRTAIIRVRPGRGRDYEEQLRIVKQARERAADEGLQPLCLSRSLDKAPPSITSPTWWAHLERSIRFLPFLTCWVRTDTRITKKQWLKPFSRSRSTCLASFPS